MPTTSNFGWTTPADTDLVSQGAAAIRTLGNGIDTSFLDLKGGTTDQVLAKNSNTDLDFKWVAQDDSNAIQNAIVDAKGDLISATAADTPARLASSGVNGEVLTIDTSTATGLKWAAAAGGALVISQIVAPTTLPNATSLTISNLGTYDYLQLMVYGIDLNSNSQLGLRINANSGSNYIFNGYENTSSVSRIDQTTSAQFLFGWNFLLSGTSTNNAVIFSLYNCKSTGATICEVSGNFFNSSSTNTSFYTKGVYTVSEGVSSIRLDGQGANFDGGTYQLWGG